MDPRYAPGLPLHVFPFRCRTGCRQFARSRCRGWRICSLAEPGGRGARCLTTFLARSRPGSARHLAVAYRSREPSSLKKSEVGRPRHDDKGPRSHGRRLPESHHVVEMNRACVTLEQGRQNGEGGCLYLSHASVLEHAVEVG
jgi:hypothetical protein